MPSGDAAAVGRKHHYDREGSGSGRNSVTLRRAVRKLLRYHVRHDDEGKKAAHDAPMRRC
jgi:hypothetical protein